MSHVYAFFVPGDPASQGSKSAAIGRDGRVHVYEKLGKKLKPWREAITLLARSQRKGQPPLQGPLKLKVMFHVKHPVKGPRRFWPVGVPDLDKLTRAVGDALTDAHVWVDDSQVVELECRKVYAQPDHPTGAWIEIIQIEEETKV